jgi:hypothetical protein
LQPMHVQNIVHDPIHDPRSPMGRTNTIPNHVKFVFCPFCSCSSANDIVTAVPRYSGDHRPG